MARTTALHGFSVEPARAKPVAVVSPAEISRVLGALIRLDARASSSADGEELTYAWSFVETPLGSTVSSFLSVEDSAVITFVPDMTGRYVVGLVASTPYRSSDVATAVVDVTAVQVPLLLRTTPNGEIMFNVISSFWKMVERNAVFSTLWSGYMQLAGADLLRAFQADFGKSIATIPPIAQRRWLDYSTALEVDNALCTGVFGYHQGGEGAFTPSGAVAVTGVIITDHEVLLLDGAPALSAVGTYLTVCTSATAPGNLGEYLINRLNSDGSGYIVSASTPFPAASNEVLRQGSTLVTYRDNEEVYDSDGLVDFAALGVVAGDVLRVESGSDAGYFVIQAVGVADGLTNDRTLLLATAPTQSVSGRSYTIFKRSRIYAQKQPVAATGTVMIPEAEADFTRYAARELAGGGTITGLYEIVVEPRHVLAAMAGEKITVLSGGSSGRSYTIAGLNQSGTGYLIGSAFDVTTFPTAVSYSMTSNADVSDRLLVLEDEAYEIVSVELDPGTPVESGGRGAFWAVTLASPTAPAGRDLMRWRVAATLDLGDGADAAASGITYGDLLVLSVSREDIGLSGDLPCFVLGAAGSKVAFDFGTTDSLAGGELTGQEIMALANSLQVPRVYEDEAGEVQVTLLAEDAEAFVRSTTFQSTYGNLPVTPATVFDLDGVYAVRVGVRKIVRNCRIPLDTSLVSVPALFEFIDAPAYGELETGETVLVDRYGASVTLSRAPLELIENRDYTISSDASTRGTNLETVAGSPVLRIPRGSLIDRDLRVGDYVDVLSGFDQDRYYVRSVIDDEHVHAVTATGDVPLFDATGLTYALVRRTPGNFLRFVDGMFTPAAPAPDRFWAQLSLFDNSGTIEDNFGVLVGVTKEQLDEYGSSQVSYLGAVRALMYVWASGPTVRNVTIGTHILMGLPVTEVRGQIVHIDQDYDGDGSRGRVLVEDVDADDVGTGTVRIYYFSSDETGGLSLFQGLATNPKTGATYAVLDYVDAFSPLSRGIVVSDYLTDPRWWKTGGSTGADELQKYHTWQVAVDVDQVDSRDLALVYDFVMGVRPIYTKPKVVLFLYLYDEVTVEDALLVTGTLFFSDDPVLSVEATHMVDSYNGRSLAHRLVDYGTLSTRTVFEGRDLVTVAGSGVVTSARGGFTGVLDADPLAHAPDELVGLLPGVNADFPADTYFRGASPVRPGDLLFIREGNNAGRYTVVSVDSDTQLTVTEAADLPPTSRPTAEIEAATGQVFQVQRVDAALVTSGTGSIESTSGAGDDAVTVVEDLDGNFRWNGVAVGDVLVVLSGPDYGRYPVLQVGTWSLGDLVDRDTRLVIRGTLASEPFDYEIVRDELRQNPLLAITDLETTLGSRSVTSASGGFVGAGLPPGTILRFLSGASAGREIVVLDVVADDELALGEDVDATESGIEAQLEIPGKLEYGQPRDEDWELESLCPLDDASVVILEPRTLLVAVADLTLANDVAPPDPADWTATATSALTDLEAAGVVAGTWVSVDVAEANSGTRRVLSSSANEVTIEGLWLQDEGPTVSAEFYEAAADWTVLDDTAELAGTLNLEFGPMTSTDTPEAANVTVTTGLAAVTGVGTTFETTVQVGDVVRFAGDTDLDWAVVDEVTSDTALVLDRAYTGAGGVGALERGAPGGMVAPGDVFEFAEGDFMVLGVQAATLTLTRDTGVAAPTSYTGRVTRRL